MVDRKRLAKNLRKVAASIRESCRRAGRSENDVQLLAVTKTVDAKVVNVLAELGQNRFGENRAQVGMPKIEAANCPEAEWHFIGHLQRRKVKGIIPAFSWIHSVDSIRLADEIQRCAGESGVQTNILLQIKTSEEENKQGASPVEAEAIVRHVLPLPNLHLRGLMTMAPYLESAEDCRPYFRRLAELRVQLEAALNISLPELSMGMSNDYTIAIEEGATLVRIGSALFEGLQREPETAS